MALLASMLLGTGVNHGPVCGIHTIRADDAALSLIHDAGCSFVVQHFDWSQIEPLPGEYFWEYPDSVVRACQHYGLNLVVRLDQPPGWALASGEDGLPVDVKAYAGFVSRVAQRYQGRVEAYVIWNEPNLAQEWGGRAPDPQGYVELLRAAHLAVEENDPQALVVSAGLAPTNRLDQTAVDDRVFLEAMYEAGAGEFFDVLGAHPYGFAYPPDDPHDSHEGLNFARLEDLREILVAFGEVDKPVWATEVGWTTEAVSEEQAWLVVTEEEQAAYLVGAFEKTAEEWPWLERIAVWNLSAGLEADDEKRGYSIVDDQYEPRPAYEALAAMPKASLAEPVTPVSPDDGSVEILAPDVVVRLGDVDTFHPHWARIYGGEAPCRYWRGEFYLDQPDGGVWQLALEKMQVEEQGNVVKINGQPLEPVAIPLRSRLDFASSWTTAFLDVPPGVLRSGLNVIEVLDSPRLPVYQDGHASFESLQFRHLRLVSVGAD
jgi:GH35 family endo-1,4-beta-xylanase